MKTLLTTLLSVYLMSCNSLVEASQNTLALHNTYIVSYMQNYTIEEHTKAPTLEIYVEDERFIGNGGCNTIQGTVKADNDSINFNSSPIMTTLMICEWDSMEQAFLKALDKINTYQLSANELILQHNNEQILKLIRVD